MANRKGKPKFLPLLLLLLLSVLFAWTTRQGGQGVPQAVSMPPVAVQTHSPATAAHRVTSKPAAAVQAMPGERDAVAAYIAEYGALPEYYITKDKAREMGWTGGSLEPYAPGRLIGGDRFGNFEGLLPQKSGRTWTECDINTWGRSSRGAERIVFSNDGLMYYTDDHYESFVRLNGGMN